MIDLAAVVVFGIGFLILASSATTFLAARPGGTLKLLSMGIAIGMVLAGILTVVFLALVGVP